MAGGSALAAAAYATAMSAVTGNWGSWASNFETAFQTSYIISAAAFFTGLLLADSVFGGGVANVGGNGFNGWVQSVEPIGGESGGITFGSTTILSGASPGDTTAASVLSTFAEHEPGHTIQFIGLSAISGALGTGQVPVWASYLGLGLLGTQPAGAFWENAASRIGIGFGL